MVATAYVVAGLAVGFLLPGYLVARLLDAPARWSSAFLLSYLILFHSAFWVAMCGLSLDLTHVLTVQGLVAAAAWGASRFRPPRTTPTDRPTVTGALRLMPAFVAVIVALTLLRSTLAPLSGDDVLFRWEFLARQILRLQRFDFYPPRLPEHFSEYFWVDGIPPLASFGYWYVYALAGEPLLEFTGIMVTGQVAATLGFVYRIGCRTHGPPGGWLACGALAACPAFLSSALIGQETGLTALAMSGLLCYLDEAQGRFDWRAAVLGGAAAATAALAREYGWAFVPFGLATALWKGQRTKSCVAYLGAATLVALPWYVRTWTLTGNPFYSLRVADLPVNPVLASLMDFYQGYLHAGIVPVGTWRVVVVWLAFAAPLQLSAGIVGTLTSFRRNPELLCGAAMVTGLYLLSVGYTTGGPLRALRVASPAMVMLSVAAVGPLLRVLHGRGRHLARVALAATFASAAAFVLVFPESHRELPVTRWATAAMQQRRRHYDEHTYREELLARIPPGSRILSDSPLSHAALHSSGVDVLPPWSPEVDFLFAPDPVPGTVTGLLRERNIRAALFYPQTTNGRFFESFPGYREILTTWRPVAAAPDNFVLYRMPDDPEPHDDARPE